MDTYVAERPRTVAALTGAADRHEIDGRAGAASARRSDRADWRWVTDPADVDVPPPAHRRPYGSSVLVKALAWVSLQYRA